MGVWPAVLGLLLAAGGTFQGEAADGASPASPPAGAVVTAIRGDVRVERPGAPAELVRPGEVIPPGSTLVASTNSRALLRLNDRALAEIGPGSRAVVQPSVRPTAAGSALELLRGVMRFFLNRDDDREDRVRDGSAAALGTEYVMTVDGSGALEIAVFAGTVQYSNAAVRVEIPAGQTWRLGSNGVAEPLRPALDMANVLQWTIDYPGFLDPADLGPSALDATRYGASLAAYRRGNLVAAFQALPEAGTAPGREETLYRSALFLAMGDVPAAEALLARGPAEDRLAAALRRVVAAAKFQELPPGPGPATATEWLAESIYAQSRASREGTAALDRALAAARQAVAASPGSGFAQARLAELLFGSGRVREAREGVARALAVSPDHAAAHSLQGFLLAAENRLRPAQEAFERALEADDMLAEAWLGRGLTRIRRGDPAGGRADLQVAAALEPHRAVLRSYLGKSFSDRGDWVRSTKELARAVELDPADPTGWLYRALDKLGQNRVNEAIADLEQAKAENDRRGLYRSSLLLDQDRAVKSANLARIYQDAGMTDVAFREASSGVTADYGNYSTHLFLANAYNSQRDPNLVNLRFETAAYSEYLLANLLSPVGAGTLSPVVSQREYSKLLDRDGPGLTSFTEYTSNGNWTEEGAQFGTFGGFSYSLEGYYRNANGDRIDGVRRPNHDSDQSQITLRVKQELSPRDMLLLEVSYVRLEGGDLRQLYDPSGALDSFRSLEKQQPLMSLGYRHDWGPGQQTLVLGGWFRDRLTAEVPTVAFPTFMRVLPAPGEPAVVVDEFAFAQSYASELDLLSGEVQHLSAWNDRHHSLAGVRYQAGELDSTANQFLASDDWSIAFDAPYATGVVNHLSRVTAYAYHNWEVLNRVWLVGGITYDRLDHPLNYLFPPLSEDQQVDEVVGPKAGFVVEALKGFTFRGAYARALSGATAEQSYRLEPAQVAGFTTAYRNVVPESAAGQLPGTTFDTFNLAFEGSLKSRTYLGLVGRWVESDSALNRGAFDFWVEDDVFRVQPTTERHDLEYQERGFTAYAHQLLGDWFGVGARYSLVESELDTRAPGVPAFTADAARQLTDDVGGGWAPYDGQQWRRATLHQMDLLATFNHSSGLFSRFEAVWRQQSNEGYAPEWPDPDGVTRYAVEMPGDDFWQLNLFAGYRFPRRQAEVSVGLMNLTDQSYRLNPLNPSVWPVQERTFVVRLRLNL